MPSSFVRETSAGLTTPEIPRYAPMLDAYHRSRPVGLRATIAPLPLGPQSRVRDVACGDGCYSHWLAERAGQVLGVDLCAAYLDLALRPATPAVDASRITFGCADAAKLPFVDGS